MPTKDGVLTQGNGLYSLIPRAIVELPKLDPDLVTLQGISGPGGECRFPKGLGERRKNDLPRVF